MTSLNYLYISLLFFGLLLLFVNCNYYRDLGVSKSADVSQIKRAYRKLALKYHPDRNKGDKKASDKFIKIAKAYEILSDPQKRDVYDKFGEDGLKQHQQQQAQGFDPTNIFSQFFGGFGFGNFGGDQQQQEEDFKGEDVIIPLHITLEDLYKGKKLSFMRVRPAHEDGAIPKECKCKRSNSIRMVIINGVLQQQFDQDCSECQNRFEVSEKRSEIIVDIDPGMKDGEKIIYYGEGDATPNKRAGDLIFELHTASHPVFSRIKKDLKTKMVIPLVEALVGFKKSIKQLDGHEVVVESKDVIRPGYIMVIHGEGMPSNEISAKKGDLFIEFDVKFPLALSQEQKDELREIFQ